MTITLSEKTEKVLLEVAEYEGQEPDFLADVLLRKALEQREQELAESVASIQEGFTALEEGKTRPFEEFLTEHRARYGDASSTVP